MKSFLPACIALAVCVSTGVWQLCGQTAADVSATVQFSNGQVVTVTDFSNSVGVQPGEVVNVTIQLTSDDADQAATVAASDGGSTSIGSNVAVIGSDGCISFAFHATVDTGPTSVVVLGGSKTVVLQFWVLDSANPQNNPPVLTPANQGK
jgi:hypothetical protein